MSLRILALVLVAACSAPAAQAPVSARTNPAAPVILTVEVVSGEPVPGGRLALRANLARQGPWPYPVAVEWQLPQGVRVAAGSIAAVVGENEPSVVELELDTVPAADVVVTASSRGPDAGFNATARYRFGRPEPVPRAGPDKTGPRTEINGHDLGPAVPMTK